MSSKIDQLTQKLYNEGVEKANIEAKNIISEAEKKAEKIVNDAKNNASKIKESAQSEAQSLKNEVTTELQNASEQVVESLKQNVTDIVVANTLDKMLDKSLGDPDFLKSVITTLVKNWDEDSKNDLDLILSKDKEKELTGTFIKNVLKELNNKVEIKFDKGFKEGFIIEPKGGNFKLSFTKDDFINFFKAHLKPKVRELLFKD